MKNPSLPYPESAPEVLDASLAECCVPLRSHRSSARWDPLHGQWPTSVVTEAVQYDKTSPDYKLRLAEMFAALERVLGRRRRDAIQTLAAIHDYGALTAEQLAAITGRRLPARTHGKAITWGELPTQITDLWTLGFVRRAQIPGGPVVFTIDQLDHVDRLVTSSSDRLADYYLGGLPIRVPPPTDIRHHVLAAEAALRVQATFGPEQLVLPGRHATYSHLAADPDLAGSGDAVIYSADRYPCVAMSLATTGGPKRIQLQVTEAVDLLVATDDVLVWIIEAGDPTSADRRAWRPLANAVADVADPKVGHRLAISRWQWMWPGPGKATSDSIDGLAYTATGAGWKEVLVGRPRGDYDFAELERRLPPRTGASLINHARSGEWAL